MITVIMSMSIYELAMTTNLTQAEAEAVLTKSLSKAVQQEILFSRCILALKCTLILTPRLHRPATPGWCGDGLELAKESLCSEVPDGGLI
jgi:hypothetical protein